MHKKLMDQRKESWHSYNRSRLAVSLADAWLQETGLEALLDLAHNPSATCVTRIVFPDNGPYFSKPTGGVNIYLRIKGEFEQAARVIMRQSSLMFVATGKDFINSQDLGDGWKKYLFVPFESEVEVNGTKNTVIVTFGRGFVIGQQVGGCVIEETEVESKHTQVSLVCKNGGD